MDAQHSVSRARKEGAPGLRNSDAGYFAVDLQNSP